MQISCIRRRARCRWCEKPMRSSAVGRAAGICQSCKTSYEVLTAERQKRLAEEFAVVNGDPLEDDAQ
jgi:hypothetical protein